MAADGGLGTDDRTNVQVAKTKLQALIDSGACRSIISAEAWHDVGRHQSQVPRRAPPLYSLSGEEIKSLGIVTLMLSGTAIDAYVVPGFHHQLLLGVDSLRALDAQVDLKRNRVRLNNRWHLGNSIRKHDYDKAFRVECLEGPRVAVDKLLEEYGDLFAADSTSHAAEPPISIDTGSAKPIKQRPYKPSLMKRKVISDEVDKML